MRFREHVIRNIASPYGLTVASLLFFLAAWAFPPALYSSYTQEPDLMFLDPASLLFFLLCVLGFVLGMRLIDFFFPVGPLTRGKIEVSISPMWFILLPVIAGTALTVLSNILLLRNNVNLLELLMSAQGAQIKNEGGLDTVGSVGLASVGLMGIVWWAMWRKHQLNIRGWRSLAVQLALIVATGAMLVSATLKMGRGEFMPILAGIAVLFLLGELAERRLTPTSIFRYIVAFVILIVGSFAAFSRLRGAFDLWSLVSDLLGYTISSYNRLAAILDGRMRYPFAGRGIYLSPFVSFNETFNHLFRINSLLGWPDFMTSWRSEFGAVSEAGLNSNLIWCGTFGYIFSDLGWFSPLMLFLYGLMTGCAWRSLKLGRIAGMVLYPWLAFCILFWFGTNFLLDTKGVVLVLDVIVLGLYEWVLVRTPTQAVSGEPSHQP
jgi:hypothetical protein